MLNKKNIFSEFIEYLPKLKHLHKRGEYLHDFLQKILDIEVDKLFENDIKNLYPFGNLKIPYYEMGAVNSKHIFGLDKIILYSFYWHQRHKYKNVVDLGANIGIQTLFLSKCGFNVRSYEPDSLHFKVLQETVQNNKCKNVELFNCAVSDREGVTEFVRVLGNTTSNHIKGSKLNPYGELESYEVKTVDFKDIINWAELIKIDIEGHEKVVLLSTEHKDWENTDAFSEIGYKENAISVFNHMKKINVKMYSQKNFWQEVESLEQMPFSYKEGYLFISINNRPFDF